ncbi:MAG: dihydroorotase, multifunctional complex type, partial [Methylobacterium brachiatum]|nr:dihydroorotase, multifunctional complex type [Methylobacterium brachiatum]
MTSILLVNATLLDPATGRETRGAVLVQDGRIADIAEGAAPGAPADAPRIDCRG